MENMEKAKHFWGTKTTKLSLFCLSGNLPHYTKRYFQKEIFPGGATTARPVNTKIGRLWLRGQGLALAGGGGPAGKPVFQIPRCPAPFRWVQEFSQLLSEMKWEKFTVPVLRNHGRKMKHPPGAIGRKWSCCQETIAAFSFTPKPLSLG